MVNLPNVCSGFSSCNLPNLMASVTFGSQWARTFMSVCGGPLLASTSGSRAPGVQNKQVPLTYRQKKCFDLRMAHEHVANTIYISHTSSRSDKVIAKHKYHHPPHQELSLTHINFN